MIKKLISVLLIFTMLLPASVSFADAGSIPVYINGEKITFDQNPVIENDRTLVPLRKIFESLGATVNYDENEKVVSGEKEGIKISLKIGEDKALVDGKEVALSQSAKIENGRTLVPLRFISEAFGDYVEWDDKNRRIFITQNNRAKKAPELGEIPTADAVLDKLPEGEVIFTHEDLMNEDVFEFRNSTDDPEGASYRKVSVEGMPFKDAYRVNVVKEASNNYQYVFHALGKGKNIKDGDIVLVALTLRNINANNDDNTCSVELVYEQQEDPWEKHIRTTFSAGLEWKTCYFARKMEKGDANASDMKMVFRLGATPQEFEIADFKMINYGQSVTLEDMPKSSYDAYEGMEDDAEWRKDADERIEKFRKGDMKFTVVDQNGNKVPDAKVSVDMTNHEFEFGTVLWDSPEYSDNEKYFEVLKETFNTLVIGNRTKWEQFEKYPDRARSAVEWAYNNGFNVRGHTMVWDHWKHMPADLKELGESGTYEEALVRFEEHIKDVGTAFDDYIYEWDVLNEPIANVQFRKKFGYEFAAKWFEWAEKYAPNAKRVLNDTGIVGFPTPKVEQLYTILDNLIALGADIEGLGIQGHFGVCCNPESFYKQLDELSKRYDLPIKVTEYSHSSDPTISGYFSRDILTEAFSLEKGNGFIMWGMSEAYGSGGTKRPMYDKNWNLKPAGEQMLYLMYDKWWTNNIGVTDNDGEYNTRGFYGDYEITTEVNGVKQLDVVRVLKDKNNEFIITLGSPVFDTKAQNKVKKKAVKELGDEAWEEVKTISFDKDDLSFVKSTNLASGISYNEDEKALKIVSNVTDGKITVDGVFEGLDLSSMTPYKITFDAKGEGVIYPSISLVTQKDGEIKISDVFNDKNSLNLTYTLEDNYNTYNPKYYYVDGKKPTGISFTVVGEYSEAKPYVINIDNIKIYKLKDEYMPQ